MHYEMITIIIAGFSLLFSAVAICLSLRADRRSQRSLLAERLSSYAHSFADIKKKVNPRLEELRVEAGNCENCLYRIVDKHTTDTPDGRPPRHVLVELCDYVFDTIRPSLENASQAHHALYDLIFFSNRKWKQDKKLQRYCAAFDQLVPADERVVLLHDFQDEVRKYNKAHRDCRNLLEQSMKGIEGFYLSNEHETIKIEEEPVLHNQLISYQKNLKMCFLLSLDDIADFDFEQDKAHPAVDGYVSECVYMALTLRTVADICFGSTCR